ncbi:MAG TPA: aldose 1-epimerase [Polyangiaceae bacterium]|nr:aldose 1-epimerase [Polyangiaceae bacterium]
MVHTLVAGDLKAVVWPGRGMLIASLRHRQAELLRRVEDLEAAAAGGKTAGVPLLYPWANRLSGLRYTAGGRQVTLDRASPLLHFDERGLPIHGVPWSRLAWLVTQATSERLTARLDWSAPELLAIFPFPHRVELAVTLGFEGLTFETALEAGAEGPVPVSFGFHPYVGLPGLGRADWRLTLPPMRRLVLDARGIPTGADQEFTGFDGPLDGVQFDDGFALTGPPASLAIHGGGTAVTIELVEGFDYAQVYAPREKDFVALEPMTAPTDALTTGRHLREVPSRGFFRAVFRIRVDG